MADFVESLEADPDKELTRLANALDNNAIELPDLIDNLAATEQRLLVLLDELIKHDFEDGSEGKVPLQYKRAVEDYFQDLSDDFTEDEN